MWTDGEFHTESSKFFCKAKGKNARTEKCIGNEKLSQWPYQQRKISVNLSIDLSREIVQIETKREQRMKLRKKDGSYGTISNSLIYV